MENPSLTVVQRGVINFRDRVRAYGIVKEGIIFGERERAHVMESTSLLILHGKSGAS